jgi:3' terminal RNA ribose 2'-O-methyltransferase Hen1
MERVREPQARGAGVFLTLTSTVDASTVADAGPATDLGYLLHKHPERVQVSELPVGRAHVFYPVATARLCTVALLLEVDPIGLVQRRHGGGDGFALGQYVNDRPYAASSLLAVALGRVFRTAMAGRCPARPELVDRPLALTVHVPALPARGDADVVRRLFAPLGWVVDARPVPLDETVPAWGDSRYVDLRLTGELRLADALTQLYVLLPVLDDAKHYWVGSDEVDKLVRAGEHWLGTHPERVLISRRYLAHRTELVASAVGRLAEVDDTEPEALDNAVPPDDTTEGNAGSTGTTGTRAPLAQRRHDAAVAALRAAGAARVIDLGCGEGALLRRLITDPAFTEIVGVDVSARALELAAKRLHLERMPERQAARIRMLQSSLTYRDARLAGYDAAVLMEVIEHLDPARLGALEHTVFAAARPSTVIVTTPNVEHNVRYPSLLPNGLRHPDHRFEWTRGQFAGWARRVAAEHGYTVALHPVGDDDPQVGPPTQLAVFTRAGDQR